MSILAKILDVKRQEVARAKERVPLASLEADCERAPAIRSLAAALRRGPEQPVRVIAEIKRASPSAGPIRPGADPVEIADMYVNGGAAAISVLTDEQFFAGALHFLPRVRARVPIPVLRKDFLIDAYQVVEARAAGADAVLLIAAALPGATLGRMLAAVHTWKMEALVEVHDAEEAARAKDAGAAIIGVNHRNLATFTVDMGLTAQLRPLFAPDTVLVGESGIRNADDVRALGAAGAHAVLVGEHLMRTPNPGETLRPLAGVVP